MTDGNEPTSTDDEPDESGWDEAASSAPAPSQKPALKSEPPKAVAVKSEPPKAQSSISVAPVIDVTRAKDDEDEPSSKPVAKRERPSPATASARHEPDEDDEEDEDEDEEAEPEEKRDVVRRSAANEKRRRDEPERARALSRERTTPTARVEPRKKEGSGSGMLWIALIAVGLLGAWWFLHEPKKDEPTAETSMQEQPAPPKAAEPMAAPPPPEPVAPPPTPTPTPEPAAAEPSPTAQAPSTASAPIARAQQGASGTFDRIVALKEIGKNANKASRCRMRGEEAGDAEVLVTFEPSGRVQEARILSGPYRMTHTGKCVIDRISQTTIAPFSGGPQKVTAQVSVR